MTQQVSLAEELASLPPGQRARVLAELPDGALAALLHDWSFWARAEQLAPDAPGVGQRWSTWLLLAGRGFGKTRAGAEWVRGRAEAQPDARIALVGSTLAEAREVMVEGESGLLAVAPPVQRPRFQPSLRLLSWPNGSQARLYSAEQPDQLRGPQQHFAWCDELAKWSHAAETWMNLQMGLRLGAVPQCVVTTTPRPTPLLKKLLVAGGTVVTRGKTSANRAFLSPHFLAQIQAEYAGTRLGRQELDGELVDDLDGALWTREMIERSRVTALPEMTRIVVAIDPPVTATGDQCGLVVAGLGVDGHGYALADASAAGLSPEQWCARAIALAEEYRADRLIAEVNNGGDLVETLLRARRDSVPYRAVRAARGKSARAEPVAALYERGMVHHLHALPELEDQLCGLLTGGGYAGPGRSPDRADALVWAMSELMLGRGGGVPRIRAL